MENRNYGQTILRGATLSLIFIALYHFLVTSLAVVELNVVTDTVTKFKIYYSDSTKSWSEKRMAEILIKPDITEYSMHFTDLKKVAHIRIDTSEKKANVRVASLVFSQPGFAPVTINSPQQFENLEIGGGVADFSYSAKGFTVKASSNDPNLFYALPPLVKENIAFEQYCRMACLILFGFALAFASQRMSYTYSFVLPLGLVVLTLITVMASLSNYNQHPDEGIHVEAARYYMDHNLPPQIGDPAIAHTYSCYGMSRLNTGEISYFFAGKFAKFLEPLQIADYRVFRYFNVSLFGFLLLMAAYKKPFRLLLLPLLLSPQIWYIFSYFNSEGFAMVVILLIAYQMVASESAWNRLLSTSGKGCAWWELPGIVILLGFLLLLKVNFYFFGMYIFGYFLWRLFFAKTQLSKRTIIRVGLVALAGITFFAGVRVYDNSINDFDKSARIYDAREKYADDAYKPSTPLEKKFFTLQMKDRGVTIESVFNTMFWGEKIFRSSFGEYGYTSVAASYGYYDFVRYLLVVVVLTISFFTIKNGGWEGVSLLGITFVSGLLLVIATFYHAWTVDFQAQGRYLLPIVGMLSIFTYHMRERLANLLCTLVIGALYMVSLYSFIFVALAGIPETTVPIG